MAKPMPLGMWTRVGTRKHLLDVGAHWHNLANTIEPSMCSGDTAFLANYFDDLLPYSNSIGWSLNTFLV